MKAYVTYLQVASTLITTSSQRSRIIHNQIYEVVQSCIEGKDGVELTKLVMKETVPVGRPRN